MKTKSGALVSMALSFVTVGAIVASPSVATASTSKQITYWYPWGGTSQTYDLGRVTAFEKANPGVKVNAVYVPPDSGITNGKLLAAIAGHTPPDLVITDSAQEAYALAQSGAVEPITQYLKELHVNVSSFLPGIQKEMQYNGQYYLFPETSNVDLLYYNKTMFKEAGLNPNNPPKTIAQLDADAAKLTKISKSGKIERMGFIPWLDDGGNAWLWGWMFGAHFYNPATRKIELDTPAMVNMFNWMDTYAKKYDPTKLKSFSSGFGGAFSPDHPFFTGEVAMTVNGNYFGEALRQYAPKLDFGVAAIPAPPGGRYGASDLTTNMYMIPKGAKDPLDALKLAIYSTSGNELASNINVWRTVAANPSGEKNGIVWYNKQGQVSDPEYKVVLKVAESPNTETPALTSVATEMSNDLLSIEDQVLYQNAKSGPLLLQLQNKLQAEIH